MITYLEYSFDERAKNFQILFSLIDRAIPTGDNGQLAMALHSIVELAKSSPFQELANLATIEKALNEPEFGLSGLR